MREKRRRVERLSRFITWVLVVTTLTIGSVFAINGYVIGVISTTIWFYARDLAAYILEEFYHIEHDLDRHR